MKITQADLRLILRNRRVDLITPCQNSAGHVSDILEAVLLQEVNRFLTAGAGFAVGHNLGVRIEFAETLREITERNQR